MISFLDSAGQHFGFCSREMKGRPTFVLVLRPLPGVDGIRALRAALKFLLRRFSLRVVEIKEQQRDDIAA